MSFRPKTLAALTGVGLLALASQTVTAGTASCPTDGSLSPVTITTAAGSPSCITFGNVPPPVPDVSTIAGYENHVLLDKQTDNEGALAGLLLDAVVGSLDGGTSGTIGLKSGAAQLLAEYGRLVLGMKRGNTQPEWVYFLLPDVAAFDVVWAFADSSTALSNTQLWGETTVVPLPAAAWLFGSALLGMVGIGYRRRQTA